MSHWRLTHHSSHSLAVLAWQLTQIDHSRYDLGLMTCPLLASILQVLKACEGQVAQLLELVGSRAAQVCGVS